MRKLIGVLFIITGVVLGAYVGFWVLFIGGILNVIDGAKADPTNGGLIAWGLVKSMLLAETVGALIFWSCAATGTALFGWGGTSAKPGQNAGTSRQIEARWRDVTRDS
jgi:hypothetical protein